MFRKMQDCEMQEGIIVFAINTVQYFGGQMNFIRRW